MNAYLRAVSSDPTTDFIEQLIQDQISATVNLKLPTRHALWEVKAIELIATENLTYELWLFNSATNFDGTINGDRLVGIWQFGQLVAGPPASPGYTVLSTGAGVAQPFFRNYVDGNDIPYFDADQMAAKNVVVGGAGATYPANGSLHCRLVNRSATQKDAAGPGALKVTFYLDQQGILG